MVQFTIVNESLKIIDDTKTVVFIAKKDVYAISQSLYQDIPVADIYNLNLGYLALVFTRNLSECLDPNGDPFTVDSFIVFVETYLGFNTGVIPQTITVVLNYNFLPDPTTVDGEFYWCQEAIGIYPIGLYYSNGVSWEYNPLISTPNLQQVVNAGNGISNYGGNGTAFMQSTNFVNNRTLYLNQDTNPTIKFEDNLDGTHYSIFDIDTLNLSGTSYTWNSIINGSQNLQSVTDIGAVTTNSITANSFIKSGGTSSEILMADGSIVTAGQNISISNGEISAIGGSGGGGNSVFYYLNGGTASTVATYYQMSNTPVIGAGTNFTKAGNGLISQWLTDVGNPARLQIPAGTWNFEIYMSASNNTGTPAFYIQVLKYDGTIFTEISNSSLNPEEITGGTVTDLYLTSVAIPETTLLVTDRLALRFYIVNNTAGRTITMHTEDSNICQVITNFTQGITALNGLTATTQNFATSTSGTDFSISSASTTHTFNLPTASASNRGALSTANWSTFNGKADVNSQVFTGTPTLPSGTIGVTQTAGNSTTALATTAFVTTADNLKANIASPTFTGIVTIPSGASISGFAPLASPTFTGTPTLPSGTIGVTQLSSDSSTKLATTAFVNSVVVSKAVTGLIIVTSGTSFITPSTITSTTIFVIEIVGAGGGGGGGVTAGNGSGGGGGGYACLKFTGLTASTTYTCAIGVGGSGGAGGASGTAGTNTSITIASVTYVGYGGGFGQSATTSVVGGAGGSQGTVVPGGIPQLNINGQAGNSTGTANNATAGGFGGNSGKGFGIGGTGVGNATVGLDGVGYGGGGSAGHGSGQAGGNGSNGIIYCTYYN